MNSYKKAIFSLFYREYKVLVMKVFFIIVALFSNMLYAKPFTPQEMDGVIYTIKQTQTQKNVVSLLQAVKKDPDNLSLVDKTVSLYIEIAKQRGEASTIGYAQSFIEPYRKKYPDSYMLNMHYADILQYTHRFDEALVVLDNVLEQFPKDSKAYLLKAIIYQAKKEYKLALQSCTPLLILSSSLLSTTCITTMQSYIGGVEDSYKLLQRTYEKMADTKDTQTLRWTLTSLADMAYRFGDKDKALMYLNKVLKLKADDYYALKIMSEILIEEKKYISVIDLLDSYQEIESLYLRFVVAKKLSGENINNDRERIMGQLNILKLRNEKAHEEDEKYYKMIVGER